MAEKNTLTKVAIGAVALVAVAIFGVALSSGGSDYRWVTSKLDAPPDTKPVDCLAPGPSNHSQWLAWSST